MADVTVNKNVLKIVAAFADDDDRTITVENPAASIASAAIVDLNNYLLSNSVLVGDQNGSAFVGFRTVKISTTETTDYDLS